MISVSVLFFFACTLLLSVTGWGWMALGIVRRYGRDIHGPAAPFGLAVALAGLGVLNGIHALRPVVYAGVFLIGFAAFAIVVARRWCGDFRELRPHLAISMLFVISVAAALPVLTRFATAEFNPADDATAYLVDIGRIMDLGTVDADPFNYRMAVSGSSGMASLQAPLVGLMGWRAAGALDQVFGTMLYVGSIAWLIHKRRVSLTLAVVMLVAMFALATFDIANVTSYFTSLALLVALFAFLTDVDNPPLATAMFAGIIIAGMSSLKYTWLPTALLLTALSLIRACRNDISRLARATFVFFVSAGVPLFIWTLPRLSTPTVLISLRHGSGTDEVSLKYLIRYFWGAPERLYMTGYAAALLLVGTAAILICRKAPQRSEVAVVFAAALMGSIATTWLTGGVAFTRYNRPVAIVACVLLTVIAASRDSLQRWQAALMALALIVGMTLCRNSVKPWTYWDDYKKSLEVLATPIAPYPPPEAVSEIDSLQASMVPNAAALIRLDRPYLLNFSRNRLYVVDFPYAASLSPGMAACLNVNSLVSYLKAHSIRYVAYSYANEANFPTSMVKDRLTWRWHFTPWQRTLNRKVPPFNALLSELMRQRGSVYDDGHAAVVDISGPPHARYVGEQSAPAPLRPVASAAASISPGGPTPNGVFPNGLDVKQGLTVSGNVAVGAAAPAAYLNIVVDNTAANGFAQFIARTGNGAKSGGYATYGSTTNQAGGRTWVWGQYGTNNWTLRDINGARDVLIADTSGNVHVAGGVNERGRATPLGDWVTIPYNAAEFTAAGGGSWSVTDGNRATDTYTIIGNTVVYSFRFEGTTVNGTCPVLRRAIPGGLTAAADISAPAMYSDGSQWSGGVARVTRGGTEILFYPKDLSGQWPMAPKSVTISGTITFPIP